MMVETEEAVMEKPKNFNSRIDQANCNSDAPEMNKAQIDFLKKEIASRRYTINNQKIALMLLTQ